MGVQGLWSLLDPVGKPVTLESLQGKVLAVDVSMWLHQSMKGMRDHQGNAVHNAHLQVLFNRVCKLLFYKIKPIFVFDGGVPALKRQTLAARRQKRDEATISKEKTAKKLLINALKHHAVGTVLGSNPSGSQVSLPSVNKERDMFELKPIPELDRPEEPYEDDPWQEGICERQDIYSEFQDLEDIDIESEDFKCLPADMRHEILSDLKDSRKRNSLAKLEELPNDSLEFSSYQMKKLMKQSKLSQKIYNVRKELNSQTSGEIVTSLTEDRLASEVISSRVASDDSTHYILVKGLSKIPNELKHDNVSNKEGLTELCVQNIKDNVISKDKLSESVEEANRSMNGNVSRLSERSSQNTDIVPVISNNKVIIDISMEGGFIREDSEDSVVLNTDVAVKRKFEEDNDSVVSKTIKPENLESRCKQDEVLMVPSNRSDLECNDNEKCVNMLKKGDSNTTDILNESGSDTVKHIKRRKINDEVVMKSSKSDLAKVEIANTSNHLCSNSFKHVPEDSTGLKLESQSVPVSYEETNQDNALESSESENDDFIEVIVDPKNLREEDMFPLSMFEPVMPNIDHNEVLETSNIEDKLGGNETSNIEDKRRGNGETPTLNHILDKEDSAQDIVNVFEGMSQSDMKDLQFALEDESSTLIKERAKMDRLATSITDQIQKEAQDLLMLFGIPFVISPMEAEAQCAFLDFTHQTSGTITDDSDIWLFGGKNVYKNLFNQNKHVHYYSFTDIEKSLLLNQEKLINLAYLCGCDYTEGIQGIGPVTAMEILLEFPGEGIEGLEAFKSWWDDAKKTVKVGVETKLKNKLRTVELNKGFPNKLVLDAYLNPEVDNSKEKFLWESPDLDLLRNFANDKLGWSKNKVDEMLLPVVKELNKMESQTQMTHFFIKEVLPKSNVRSKRLKRVIDRMKDKSADCEGASKNSKGKSCKKLPAKNSKMRSTIAKNNSGGWVNASNLQKNDVKLSESSSDSDA